MSSSGKPIASLDDFLP